MPHLGHGVPILVAHRFVDKHQGMNGRRSPGETAKVPTRPHVPA
jgi:hypothetical protein